MHVSQIALTQKCSCVPNPLPYCAATGRSADLTEPQGMLLALLEAILFHPVCVDEAVELQRTVLNFHKYWHIWTLHIPAAPPRLLSNSSDDIWNHSQLVWYHLDPEKWKC